jgi:hypothetical protein
MEADRSNFMQSFTNHHRHFDATAFFSPPIWAKALQRESHVVM